MRVIDHPVYRTWHRQMTVAWRRYDQSTAYGCAQADRPFDPDVMTVARTEYDQTLQSIDWTQVDRDLCLTPTA